MSRIRRLRSRCHANAGSSARSACSSRGREHASGPGQLHEAARQVDDGTVVVAFLGEDGPAGEPGTRLGQQLVDRRPLGEAKRDPCRAGGVGGDEHHLVADGLDDAPAVLGHGVVRELLEPAHERTELLGLELLAQRGVPDEVDEPDRQILGADRFRIAGDELSARRRPQLEPQRVVDEPRATSTSPTRR